MKVRRVASLVVVITVLTISGLAQAKTSKTPKPQQDAEQYIIQSERDWAESVASGDAKVIERILADDFIGVDPDGKQYDKKKMVEDTPNAPKEFASNHLDHVKVRFYGDTAVAQGDETWERRDGKRGRFVWTDTWVKRNGKWQIVAAEDLIAPEK